MLHDFTSSALFGLALSLLFYLFGVWLNKKIKTPLVNPLLVAVVLVLSILSIFDIPMEDFMSGGSIIAAFLTPATVALALSIYNQRKTLKAYFFPVVLGCFAGSVTSMGSIYLMCRLFKLDETLTMTLLPKSVTTPIAMSISEGLGGIPSVTVAMVVGTGILGALICPILIQLFEVKDPVAQGVATGTCSHAIGTSKVMELGELQGAMSSIAIGIAGLLTSFIALFL